MKLLIVDDKEENLYMLEILLGGSGYEVVSAKNGVEALEKLKRNFIDMIISDILMPKMDGFQLCRECKSNDTLRKIPFVFYTATYTNKKDEEFALSLGAEKFIIKPVDPDVFLKILEGVIEERRKGALVAPKKPIEEEGVYLKQYNVRLIQKLEKKMQDLENANKELKESEARSRLILQTMPSGLFSVDLNRKITSWNKEAKEITGLKAEEVIGKDCLEALNFDDCKKGCVLLDDKVDKPIYGKECLIHVDGEDIALLKNADILRDSEGNTVGGLESFIDITERKQAEDQIKASLKEKEVLLREIHHRVKNNLQVMSSLLNMQARATKDEKTVDILLESRNRINAMALIHSQLYESSNFSEVNIKRFIEGLLLQLFRNYPVQDTKITPVVHIDEYPLPISIAVPAGLVVNELLTNAFKYALVNRKEGKIEVSLSASETGKICLTVSDDGVGLPEGFDINATKTLGMRLVKILVEDQLQGKLDVVSDKGTTFKVEFEIARE